MLIEVGLVELNQVWCRHSWHTEQGSARPQACHILRLLSASPATVPPEFTCQRCTQRDFARLHMHQRGRKEQWEDLLSHSSESASMLAFKCLRMDEKTALSLTKPGWLQDFLQALLLTPLLPLFHIESFLLLLLLILSREQGKKQRPGLSVHRAKPIPPL